MGFEVKNSQQGAHGFSWLGTMFNYNVNSNFHHLSRVTRPVDPYLLLTFVKAFYLLLFGRTDIPINYLFPL